MMADTLIKVNENTNIFIFTVINNCYYPPGLPVFCNSPKKPNKYHYATILLIFVLSCYVIYNINYHESLFYHINSENAYKTYEKKIID